MVCRYCGSEFEPKKRGRKNTGFCCKRCADNWRTHNKYNLTPKRYTKACAQCGAEFRTNREEQKYCSKECGHAANRTGRTVYTKTCLYCGHEFQTIYKDHKYCSSTCAARDAGEKRKGEYFCEYCGKPRWSDHPNRNRFCSRECADKNRVLQYLPVKYQRAKEAREQREAALQRLCPECGVWFRAASLRQHYCSPQCQYKHALEESHKSYVENFQPRLFTCQECGKVVTTSPNDTRRYFCSDECSDKNWKRKYKRNRKKQLREAFVEEVDLWKVYERDQGICTVCGLPVPRLNDPANIWSPTVDHVVPLSTDGLHCYDNSQLTHRLCNSFKGQEKEFSLDWKQKLIDEPGKWNDKLDELWLQIGMKIECPA